MSVETKTVKRKTKNHPRPVAPVFSASDWGDTKLTEKQRAFIFYFTWPGQEGFHCVLRAARRAGYVESTAKTNAYSLLHNPKIQKLITKFESAAKASVHDAAARFVQEKIIRADFDVADFFQSSTWTNEKTGEVNKKFEIKDLDELTPEQRLCIDGIDAKGGVPVLVLADRQKERDSVIALDRVWNGAAGGDGQDVEEIKEVIIERVTVRHERRMKAKQAAEVADGDFEIIETSDEDDVEEF
jgi:hypothetical protein